MSTKHTPGPWRAETFAGQVSIVSETDGALRGVAQLTKLDFTEYRRANLRDQSAMLGEQVANARLIAAAPAMLEALKLIIEKNPGAVYANGTDDYDGIYSEFDKAFALIARIEGTGK